MATQPHSHHETPVIGSMIGELDPPMYSISHSIVVLEEASNLIYPPLPADGQIDGMLGKSYAGQFSYKPGECWFIPAEFGSRGYYPNTRTSLLVASPINPKDELEK